MVNIVLAGGGSSGHTSPLIATAEALRERGVHSLTCVGTARGLETRVIPAAGLPLELIDPVPMPRKPNLDLIKLPYRLGKSVSQARAILSRHGAQVLVGFGGYVSMPAYLAARLSGVPVVIHEQNAVPGLANKVAAKFAALVTGTFPGTPLPKVEIIGMPLRRAITALSQAGRSSQRGEAAAALGLDPDRPTLLVSGGSQGARSINQALLACRDELLAAGVQILHVWGPKNLPEDAQVITDATTGAAYHPVAYVDAMEQAYAAADLMVGRSGAGTVAETAAIGLPAIFVPLPHGNGEQARNADALVRAGGAVLIPDADLNGERLREAVLARIQNPTVLGEMSAAGMGLMRADAADVLAEKILAAAGLANSSTQPPAQNDSGDADGTS